ncbi:MAG: hypothetical protein ACWGQW_15720 [bacterium]
MSPQNQEDKAQERLSQIDKQTAQLHEGLQESLEKIRVLGEQLLDAAQGTCKVNKELANLRAEARFICLTHGLRLSEQQEIESHLEVAEQLWREVVAQLRPVGPSEEWISKIRNATVDHQDHSFLSQEESAELRERLEETICPLCVNFALDGTCTLEAFDECPIGAYQDRVVEMIQKMGHRPWMEDYFQSMYKDICPLCRDKSTGGVCVPREEGDCALFSYLPAVVKTVGEFMKERTEKS